MGLPDSDSNTTEEDGTERKTSIFNLIFMNGGDPGKVLVSDQHDATQSGMYIVYLQ